MRLYAKPSRLTKDQLENAIRNAQAQLHAAGVPVSVGAVERRVAQALCAGSLGELGFQPKDLAAIQVRGQPGLPHEFWAFRFLGGGFSPAQHGSDEKISGSHAAGVAAASWA